MKAHVQYAAGAKHQRRVADVTLEEQGAERAFLGDEDVARRAGHGQPGAGQKTGFTHLSTNDETNAGAPCRVHDGEGP